MPKAKNIPMDKVVSEAGKYLDVSKEYYIICHSGVKSSRARSVLKEMGFNIIKHDMYKYKKIAAEKNMLTS